MMSSGKLAELLVGKTKWTEYKERLDFFFTATGVTETDKMWAIFLSVADPALYSVMRSSCTPDSPNSRNFADLLVKLEKHFSPKLLKFFFGSNSINETKGETKAFLKTWRI